MLSLRKLSPFSPKYTPGTINKPVVSLMYSFNCLDGILISLQSNHKKYVASDGTNLTIGNSLFKKCFKRGGRFALVGDEKQCINMNAQYLQGYKYSKPIPMEHLEEFLEKESA